MAGEPEHTAFKEKNGAYFIGKVHDACSIPKDACWAEAISNSEKVKPIALAVIELHLSECVRQAVNYVVWQSD